MYITEETLKLMLKARCENGLRAFCRKHDLDAGNVSNIIAGKKPMIKIVARALGYQPKIVYERAS